MSSSESDETNIEFKQIEKINASKIRHKYRAQKTNEIERYNENDRGDGRKVLRAENNERMNQYSNENVI
jgi:hypothetical protein